MAPSMVPSLNQGGSDLSKGGGIGDGGGASGGDEAAMVAETDTAGEWSHLNPADWITNPHQPDPQENSDNSDA